MPETLPVENEILESPEEELAKLVVEIETILGHNPSAEWLVLAYIRLQLLGKEITESKKEPPPPYFLTIAKIRNELTEKNISGDELEEIRQEVSDTWEGNPDPQALVSFITKKVKSEEQKIDEDEIDGERETDFLDTDQSAKLLASAGILKEKDKPKDFEDISLKDIAELNLKPEEGWKPSAPPIPKTTAREVFGGSGPDLRKTLRKEKEKILSTSRREKNIETKIPEEKFVPNRKNKSGFWGKLTRAAVMTGTFLGVMGSGKLSDEPVKERKPVAESSRDTGRIKSGIGKFVGPPAITEGAIETKVERGKVQELIAPVWKDGSIWRTALMMTGKNRDFARAWSDPRSIFRMSDGRLAHISEINLTHPEDRVVCVLDKNGKAEYFKFRNDSGIEPGVGKSANPDITAEDIEWLKNQKDK